ncbi:unnamed protein product [Xylocopa violacea]|uniref:Transmembrane protein 223 n=1 Tax=Xylocopa violacea TaxID=135666 RepID=A0ABP1NWS2_XYLVO
MLLNTCRSINSIKKLQIVYQSLAKNIKCRNYIFRKSFHSSSKCSFNVKNTRYNNVDNFNIKVNTDILNNVILYKNDSNSDILYKVISYGWIIVNGLLLSCTYSPKYIETWFKDISWMEYVKLHGTNFLYFSYSITIGPMTCLLLYLLNQRIIQYIILHKGGNKVSIITYHLCKRNKVITLPVNDVKTLISRENMKNYLSVKIKGRPFFYLLDSDGKFLNKKLFDYTVGRSKYW